MKDQVLKRVRAGIAYLDVVQPNWVKKIKFRTFDIVDTKTCVIGSVFKDYYTGIEEIGLSDLASQNMGFSDESSDEEEWDLLGKTWVREITRLKKKAAKK